jgi:hypothetical protein
MNEVLSNLDLEVLTNAGRAAQCLSLLPTVWPAARNYSNNVVDMICAFRRFVQRACVPSGIVQRALSTTSAVRSTWYVGQLVDLCEDEKDLSDHERAHGRSSHALPPQAGPAKLMKVADSALVYSR